MVKDNNRAPDFKVPLPYIPEDEKEDDPSDGKPPSFKPLLDVKGRARKLITRQFRFNLYFMGVPHNNFFNWFKVSTLY
jgi:hypothetical protein